MNISISRVRLWGQRTGGCWRAALFGVLLFGLMLSPGAVHTMAQVEQQEDGEETWTAYWSEEYQFQLRYPGDFRPVPGAYADQGETSLGGFRFEDHEAYQGTNLLDALLLINVVPESDSAADCYASGLDSTAALQNAPLAEVVLGEQTFRVENIAQVAMGQLYEEANYRFYESGICYEFKVLFQAFNPNMVEAEDIETFDQAALRQEFLDVIRTFRVGQKPDTFVTDAIFAGDQSAEEDQAVPLAGDRADGIDVSVWQEGITWSKVAGAGYTFAFVRSSFGDSYVDPNFVDNILEARQAGMHAGAYHAANPMDPEYDPETDPAVDGYQEAMHFVNVAGDYMGEGYLRPVLDLELDRGNISRAEMTLWVHTFMSTVERETGVEPLIYTAPYIMQDEMEASITRYTLWIAHWTCDKTESPNTAYFDDWEFWQYHGPSACGVNDVPGIVDINERGVDLNVYRSDPESLPEAEVRTLDLNFTAQVVDRFAPLEIQMDAEISGTAQQPTDYALWWDCDDPGMFVGDVEGVCGALPQPADGACGENENGLRCLAVTDLTLSHLHTYASFGNYTPKLLVNREGTFSAHEQRAMRVNEPARIGERSDFNGDGVTDVAVYRPGNQTWYVKDQGKTRWGRSGDLPVPGDYDGGGLVDIAVYRPGNGKWYIRDQGSFPWGHEGDIPVPCDYTGDGITNIAVYRPGNGKWYIKGQLPVSWGFEGDVPVPADYDGNGTCDIAVYRPSNGKWYLKDQGAVSWGLTGDIPVPADYDGDRVTDIAVYRASNGSWYILGQEPVKWGSDQDIPAPGDYDGDGAAEVAVLRPGNGKWYLKDLGNYRWYSSEDYPLPVWDTNADGEPH